MARAILRQDDAVALSRRAKRGAAGTACPLPPDDCLCKLSGNQLSVDYENLQLSEGPVAPVAFYEPRLLDDTTISVDFEKNPLHRVAGPDDGVYLVAYCPELGDFDISAPACRRHNSVTLSLNPYWAGREVHLWGFVRDNAGRASMSQYIGYGTLSLEEAEETEEVKDVEEEPSESSSSELAEKTRAELADLDDLDI